MKNKNIYLKEEIASLILPILGLFILPWLVASFCNIGIFSIGNLFIQTLIGVAFFGTGFFLISSSVFLFIEIGRGTLAPWHPTQKLVISGAYKYTRNPMIAGVIFIIFAEAFLLMSLGILVYGILFLFFNTLYFKFLEEPELVERFGKDYIEYRKNVPMWIPRIRPYQPK
jgi:protein-S-isoprenylcysteine O-methyltransferase Ste14